MPKTGRPVAELIFVLAAASMLFVFTFHWMSMDGVLPGNDPAVHLGKTGTIISNKGVAYSDIQWYPPLFHTFLAILLLFAGAADIATACLILKLVVATITVLILLSTYLLCRRFLGLGVAVCSVVFTFASAAFFEMIFWGGYPSYLGLAYIPFILYVAYTNLSSSVKTFLLLLMSFALVLTHQLSALVFFLLFIPSFLVGSVRSKKRFLAFLAVVVGSGLGILAWYSDMILRYYNVMIYHLLFEMKGYIQSIPAVSLDSFIKTFGLTLFLAFIGIPFTLVLLKKRKLLSVNLVLFLWLAVPFILSQSYLFGVYVLYERFVPYLATPLTIFASVAVYNIAKLPSFLAAKVSNVGKKNKWKLATQVLAFVFLASLFFYQSSLSLQQIQSFPKYYEICGLKGLKASEWLQRYSLSSGPVVVSEKPGAWLHAITDYATIEEVNPLYGRNVVAEAVEYLFFEVENNNSLTREHLLEGSLSGQTFYSSVYNLWENIFSISDRTVYVTYWNGEDNGKVISLAQIPKETYWIQKSHAQAQMISTYSHELFTVEKRVSINQTSPLINLKWTFTARQSLANATLRVYSYMNPALDFREALVPGLLQWQNPWDNPSHLGLQDEWAAVECPPNNLSDNFAALRDSKNGRLVVFEFDDLPDWFNVGALSNRFIDALRIEYKFGALTKNENCVSSFSVLTASFEPHHFEWETEASLKQLLHSQIDSAIQTRDFQTYVNDYNIEFVVVYTQQLSTYEGWSRVRDIAYHNGDFAIYVVKR